MLETTKGSYRNLHFIGKILGICRLLARIPKLPSWKHVNKNTKLAVLLLCTYHQPPRGDFAYCALLSVCTHRLGIFILLKSPVLGKANTGHEGHARDMHFMASFWLFEQLAHHILQN